MRIARIEAWICHFPLPRAFEPSWTGGIVSAANSCAIWKLTTDDGIEGVTAGIAVGREAAAAAELLQAYLMGRDPSAVEDICKTLRTASQVVGIRAWHIEPALWDIVGKAAGMPVHRLLGGARDSVQAYASTAELKSPQRHVEDCRRLVELGFRAVKLRVRHPTLAEDIAVVTAVREQLGDDLAIMVDANQGWRVHGWAASVEWDLKRAVTFARACEDLDVYWLEEPLYQHDYEGYAALRSSTDIRIAGGEMLAELHPFRELLERGGLDVVQPDAMLTGGILNSRKVAALAEAFGAQFAPHTWTNGVGLAANLQVIGAAANATWCEYPLEPGVWIPQTRDAMLTEPLQISDDGTIGIPASPGLGVQIDWDAVRTCGEKVA